MKKLTALLLTAVILLGMAACAVSPEPAVTTAPPETEPSTVPTTEPVTEPTTEPTTAPTLPDNFDPEACAPLYGTWVMTVKMDKNLQNTPDFNEEVTFQVYYTFNDDATFAIHTDEEAMETAITQFEGLLLAHLMDRAYVSFRADLARQGYSYSRIDTMWAEGEEAATRQTFELTLAGLNLRGLYSDLLRSGYYHVEDGRVYTELDGETYESSAFTVEEGQLVLQDTDNPAVYRPLCINFPLTLTAAN